MDIREAQGFTPPSPSEKEEHQPADTAAERTRANKNGKPGWGRRFAAIVAMGAALLGVAKAATDHEHSSTTHDVRPVVQYQDSTDQRGPSTSTSTSTHVDALHAAPIVKLPPDVIK